MTLVVGTKLGSFEIIGPLGSGGMGEVYRARDARLGREVAIKTLPATVAEDRDRLARFEREAKLLASLNHVHIASVYSLDEHDGISYIAMELVEGETLEVRLARGALPIDEALELGLQVAEALEAAHEKGVVHRDLKPANIMVTPEDAVKVLDFGLAKAFSADPGQPISAHSPTLSMAMTQQGLILGTAGYMSPEQAAGQSTDQRTDIWAFGVVLYEMLTGQPVFTGETVPHILAAILNKEPDWSRLPEGLPYRLRLTLERCLEKKVRDRYHSIADVRVDIEKIREDPSGKDSAPPIALNSLARRKPWLAWIAVSAAAGLVGGIGVWWFRPSQLDPRLLQFPVDLGIDGIVAAGMMPEFSPDDSEVLFVAEYADGTTALISYVLTDGRVRELPGTEGASNPFFSPTGDIGFIRDGLPWRVAREGGVPSRLDAGPLQRIAPRRGASWLAGNEILIAGGTESFFSVPQLRGEDILDFPDGLYYPDVLPGGQTALFTHREGVSDFALASIELVSLIDPDERTTLIEGASFARYLPSGYLVYVSGGAMYAAPFDPSQPETIDTSRAVPLFGFNVAYDGGGRASVAFGSSADIAVYRAGSGTRNESLVDLVWLEPDGTLTELPNLPRNDAYRWLRYSPSGNHIAVIQGLQSADSNLLVYDVERQSVMTLVSSRPIESFIWIEDDYIFYESTEGLYRVAVATAETQLLVESRFLPETLNLHLAGASESWLMISGQTEDRLLDIWQAPLLYDPAPTIGEFESFRTTPAFESLPAFSRDEQFVAYMTSPSIIVSRFPDGQETILRNARVPIWSQTSDQLFYLDGTRIMVLDYSVEDGIFIPEPPRAWGVDTELAEPGQGYIYVYSRDPNDDRFAVLLPPSNETSVGSTEVRFILNISQEIERALGRLN